MTQLAGTIFPTMQLTGTIFPTTQLAGNIFPITGLAGIIFPMTQLAATIYLVTQLHIPEDLNPVGNPDPEVRCSGRVHNMAGQSLPLLESSATPL